MAIAKSAVLVSGLSVTFAFVFPTWKILNEAY